MQEDEKPAVVLQRWQVKNNKIDSTEIRQI